MDVDGDGYISMYELEYFYEEQMQRMEAIGIETLPFNDCLCQVSLFYHYNCQTSILALKVLWRNFFSEIRIVMVQFKKLKSF